MVPVPCFLSTYFTVLFERDMITSSVLGAGLVPVFPEPVSIVLPRFFSVLFKPFLVVCLAVFTMVAFPLTLAFRFFLSVLF